MIVHLVRLNKCHCFELPRFSLPLVEDLAFLIQAHNMGSPRLSLGSPCLDHLNDPFLPELDSLRLLAEPGAPLLACHIDLTNAFWSLTLPEPYKNSFRVRIDGKSYAFSCLPFGWRFSPVICQYVLAFVTSSVDTSGVIVLHYLDDFLVVGYGKTRVGSVAQHLCDALRRAGAVISTKSVLEPVPEIQWLGKWLVLSGGGLGVFPKGQGAALLGLWIRATVLPLTRKHARKILGRFIWSLRPTVGFAPFLSGWWAQAARSHNMPELRFALFVKRSLDVILPSLGSQLYKVEAHHLRDVYTQSSLPDNAEIVVYYSWLTQTALSADWDVMGAAWVVCDSL